MRAGKSAILVLLLEDHGREDCASVPSQIVETVPAIGRLTRTNISGSKTKLTHQEFCYRFSQHSAEHMLPTLSKAALQESSLLPNAV